MLALKKWLTIGSVFFLTSSISLFANANANIIFDFKGNHAEYGLARAELHLKANYRFGEDVTVKDIVRVSFRSAKHQFTIAPQDVTSLYIAMNINGTLANASGNFQFYLDATGDKFLGTRRDGTWRAKHDAIEGNSGQWQLRTRGFKAVCRYNDNFHKAASRGDIAYVNQCLKSGMPINTREGNGWTALHSASHNGHVAVVKALLKAGSQLNLKDKRGYTARDYAVKAKYNNVVAILDKKTLNPR